MSGMQCLDDRTVLALVEGDLEPEALSAADTHLDGCDECREVLAGVARARRPAPAAEPGARVDRFVVLDVVGGGAMGVVVAAYDPKLDRKVALKLLRTLDDPEVGRARMLREAQAMARLQHPNVVAVYDVGLVDDAVFVAMELVEGESLRRWLAREPRGWREVRDVFVQAGRGLAAAHAAGIVHRDFKPDNVVVGADGRVRVTDFGLAAAEPTAGGADEAPLSLTRTGALLGTPAYMAPEQLRGAAAGERSDQFAFAVALFEALHGRRPFSGATTAELADAIDAGRPEPVRSAPGWLQAAVVRGLSSRPEHRFASMEAMLAGLERDEVLRARRRLLVAGLAVPLLVAGGLWLGDRPPPPEPCSGAAAALADAWSPERAAAVRAAFAAAKPAGAAAAETVVAGLDAWGRSWIAMHESTCQATRVRGEQSEAMLDARMACLAGQRAQAAALVHELARADATAVDAAAGAVAALPDVDACADVRTLGAVAPPPKAVAPRVAEVRDRIAAARAAALTGKPASADALVSEARALGWLPLVAEAELVLALVERAAGRRDAADEAAHAALFAAEEARDDAAGARAWIALVAIAGEGGRNDEAARRGRHALAALARVGSPPLLEAALRNELGVVAYELGRFDAAARDLDRALELRRRELGEGHPELARSHTNLGNLARLRGELDAALAHHEKARAIDEAAFGPDHPAMGRHEHNIAGILRLQGKPAEALARYERALAVKIATLGERHVDVALTHNSLGLVLVDLGRPDEARPHYERSIALFAAASHPDEALAQLNLGLLHHAAGREREARDAFDRAAALDPKLTEKIPRQISLPPKGGGSGRGEREKAPQPPKPPPPGAYGSGDAWETP
jgi:tetratricopeptide (TPR) repeat protein